MPVFAGDRCPTLFVASYLSNCHLQKKKSVEGKILVPISKHTAHFGNNW